MFSSPIFNVVIGMVLIYLLYSLFITILGELTASVTNLRSVVLRTAIERMLNDGYYKKQEKKHNTEFINWVRWLFLQEHTDFKKSFAGYFYEYPSIKYLSKVDKSLLRQTKPSYITDSYFAETLINILKDGGIGSDVMERIGFTLNFTTLPIQPKTSKNIQNLYADAANDLDKFKKNVQKWYNETMDRTNGWYKRKMQTILFGFGLLVAIVLNVDSIRIAQKLAKDKDARDKMVAIGISLSKDSSRYQDFVTNNDTFHTNAVLDTGLVRINNDINEASTILANGWEFDKLLRPDSLFVTNAATIQKIKVPVDSFIKVKGNKHLVIHSIRRINDSLHKCLLRTATFSDDSSFLARKLALNPDDGIIKKYLEDTLAAIKNIASTMLTLNEQKRKKRDTVKQSNVQLLGVTSDINETLKSGISVIDSIHKTGGSQPQLKIYYKRHYAFFEKLFYTVGDYRWLGFLITALMLSLGAPFWFDLLNKLVSLRGAGTKPEEMQNVPEVKSRPTSSTMFNAQSNKIAPITQQIMEDPVLYAIALNEKTLKNIKGVIAVNKDYLKSSGLAKTPCIEVTVDRNCNKSLIPPSFRVMLNGQQHTIPVEVVEGTIGHVHVTGAKLNPKNPHLGLCNGFTQDSEELDWGTATGLVIHTATKQPVILTCSHVLQGNNCYNGVNQCNDVLGWGKNKVGTLLFQYRSNYFDVGWAGNGDKVFTNWLKSINKPREITPELALMELPVIMNGFVSGNVDGILWNDSAKFSFLYPEGVVEVGNLLKLTQKQTDGTFKALSQHGDSGALITDEHGAPIGMVIGGTEEFTYALKLTELFKSFTDISYF